MGDIFLLVLGIIFLLSGIAGSIVPLIPGPPLSFIGMLLLRFTAYVEPSKTEAYNNLLWIFASVTLIVVIMDYVVPIWWTSKFGGSKAGVWGATIGVIIGLFFGPVGLIAGPFCGAVIGELVAGRSHKASLRSGIGSLAGFVFGVALKLSASFLMSFYFFREVFS